MKAKLLRGCAITALSAVPVFLITTPLASIALAGTMLLTHLVRVGRIGFPRIAWCWWEYLWYYGTDPRFTLKLVLTGGIPFLFFSLIALTMALRLKPRRIKPSRPGDEPIEPERSASRIHGDADWMTMEEARSIFPGAHPKWGYIPVGEAYRPDLDETNRPFDEADPETWGQGGKADILGTPLTTGAISGLIIAGSGSFKTVSFTISAMTTWRGSCVVLDPSTQVGPMVEGVRRRMGQQVALVDPEHPHMGSFNVLRCIDPGHPLAIVHVGEFVDWCAENGPTGEKDEKDDKFFSEGGKELCACLLADLLWDAELPAERRNVREWRKRITIPEKEMQKYLTGIYANSNSHYARDLAGTLMKTVDKTFSGIYKHATSDTKWLSIPAYADLLSGDSFDPADLTKGRMTVIVQIPDEAMKATPAVGRVIMGSIARTLLRAKGRMVTPVPFILDEMDLLKHMEIFAVLRDMGRKSKIPLFPMWQSVGQIEKTWGRDGKKSWYASAAWRMYAMVNDEETAEEVSKRCGTYTVITRSEGTSTSTQSSMAAGRTKGMNDNLSEQKRELISPFEVQTALRPDEAIVIVRGKRALRCGRPMFWRRREMVRQIEADRFRQAAE